MTYSLKWLTSKFDAGEALKFIFFYGHTSKNFEAVGKFVFSQWFPAPFVVDSIEYKTAEHWMMAQKALLFDDHAAFERIISAVKPGEVKEIGRQIMGFDEIIWRDRRFDIVITGNIHKFKQNAALGKYLMDTGDRIIVEASPTDIVWGIGLPQDAKFIDNPYTWDGLNLLGFALMEARDFLVQFGDFEYFEGPVVPPWRKYPDVNPLDMFWRMGKGEDFSMEFSKFFNQLSDREKVIYRLSYPASGDWKDFYE